MTAFVPIHNYSHYSILRALSKPEGLVEHAIQNGYKALALVDYNSISSCVSFDKAVKSACGKCGKQKDDASHEKGECEFEKTTIKPIFGCTVSTDGGYLTVLAKNPAGWKKLFRLVGHLSKNNNKISLDDLVKIDRCEDWIVTAGKFGSYSTSAEIEVLKDYLPDVRLDVTHENAADMMILCAEHGLKPAACHECHYLTRADARDFDVLVSIETGKKIKELKTISDPFYGRFADADRFAFPTQEDLKGLPVPAIKGTTDIADEIEVFPILGRPSLPRFTEDDEAKLLRDLCVEGWKKKIVGGGVLKTPEDKTVYGERVKHEMEVINKANLAGYFLIVQDYVNWAKNNKILVGPGRGSSGGSLISYLLNITNINPIQYDLIFSRFYNDGRNTPEKIALPDIDVDFPKFKRERVIQYVVEKYGQERVAPIVTFGKMKGRSAIQSVLRAHDVCSYPVMNRISKLFPQEAEIADQLQEQGEDSIIRWALENTPKLFSEYCAINEDGTLEGPMSAYFAQAIRLEDTIKNQGVHASGIVVSGESLREIAPMLYDEKNEQSVLGLDMSDAEAAGVAKLDILGVAALDKLEFANDLLAGRIQ